MTTAVRVSDKDVSMVDVFKKLTSLEDLSVSLNRESEDLNDIIDKVQKSLAELSLGVEAFVHLSSEDITWSSSGEETLKPAVKHTSLSYQRVGGSWAFWVCQETCLKITPFDDGDLVSEESPRKLLAVSRNIRIDALAKIPELIDVLERHATQKLETLRKAKSEINE